MSLSRETCLRIAILCALAIVVASCAWCAYGQDAKAWVIEPKDAAALKTRWEAKLAAEKAWEAERDRVANKVAPNTFSPPNGGCAFVVGCSGPFFSPDFRVMVCTPPPSVSTPTWRSGEFNVIPNGSPVRQMVLN